MSGWTGRDTSSRPSRTWCRASGSRTSPMRSRTAPTASSRGSCARPGRRPRSRSTRSGAGGATSRVVRARRLFRIRGAAGVRSEVPERRQQRPAAARRAAHARRRCGGCRVEVHRVSGSEDAAGLAGVSRAAAALRRACCVALVRLARVGARVRAAGRVPARRALPRVAADVSRTDADARVPVLGAALGEAYPALVQHRDEIRRFGDLVGGMRRVASWRVRTPSTGMRLLRWRCSRSGLGGHLAALRARYDVALSRS